MAAILNALVWSAVEGALITVAIWFLSKAVESTQDFFDDEW